jgi:outer membrane lipoprotein-sorting protein
MKNVKSYHGTFTTQMAGNTVDSVFDFQAPDKMHMNYKYSGGNVDLIIVGSEAYAKPPGAKDYIAIPSGGYNVGGINSAQVVILLNSAQNGQVVGDEQVQGVNTTHIRFTYDTNRVIDEMAQQAGQATPTPEVSLGASTADAWVDKSTGYIVQYTTSAKISAGIVTSMVVLSKFNEPINPPIALPTVVP